MDLNDPKTLQAVRQVVLILARGEQPPDGMDILPAVEFEYANVKHWPDDESGYPGLELTPKGFEAAAMWQAAN